MSLPSRNTSRETPRIEISDITIAAEDELKSIELSIGSFQQIYPCLLGSKAHKIVLSSPCQLSPSDPLLLRVNYRGWNKLASKNKISQRELLENAGPQYVGRQGWSKSYDKVNVVLGLTVSPPSANASTSRESSTGDLLPTTDAIFKLVDRFRVLVIGKVGSGKSSLINRSFGVAEDAVSESQEGVRHVPDINPAIIRENGRFILHESQGFGPGGDNNFPAVVKFLKARKKMVDVKDQVHAVWLCFPVPLSADECLFEGGVEDFFRMKARGELGSVPVITIFTKYDMLVDEVENSRAFRSRTRTLDSETRNKLLIKMTRAKFEELCVRPFEGVIGSDIMHIAVSIKEEYKDTRNTLSELAQLTADYVKQCLAVEVAVLSAVAQRINPTMKIDAVIAVGGNRYWRGLASSASFSGKTLEACLQVLHMDIVRIWNIQDNFAFLESKEFRALMIMLVGEQHDKLSNLNTTTPVSWSMLDSLPRILAACAGPADPIVLPIAESIVVAKWASDIYQKSQFTLQRLMAYIVDLTIVMQIIFGLVVNAELHLSRRLIKLAFMAFNESRERIQVHNEIKEHAKQARGTDRDAALDKILQLIEKYRMKPEDMERLQRKMAGFDNFENEPWVVPAWARTVRKEVRRFRILIVGRANAGKTTILQRVCNTTALPKIIAPNGDMIDLATLSPSAQRGEHDIENEMVFKSNPGFVFHDSRGFEAGGSSEFEVVKNFIANRAKRSILSEKLHAIWYCIPTNDANRPITRAELDFFEECGTGAVPVIVLFTKTDSMDSRTTKQLIKAGYTDEAAEQQAPQQAIINFEEHFCDILYQKKYPPTSHLFFRDMQHPNADVSHLMRYTAEALGSDKNLQQLFVSTQQTSLNLCIEYAIKWVLIDKLTNFSTLQERLFPAKEKNNIRLVLPILQWFPHLDCAYLAAPTVHNMIPTPPSSFQGSDFGWENITIEIEKIVGLKLWSYLGDFGSPQKIAKLGIATAIIAEYSFFLWDQAPSNSHVHMVLAGRKYKASCDVDGLQEAIKEAFQGFNQRDFPDKLVKIALDNRLSKTLA